MTVLAENSLLGPYRIGALIGEGGMGAVYRAQDTRLKRDVAIKVLSNIDLKDREPLKRFAQEARTTGMLNHPNLLTVFDVGASGGVPFLVSELLEGETLGDRLNRGPIAPRKSMEIGHAIAQGLAAAHEKGVIHRDLKPDNIYLTRDGRVKILDFGIAKLDPKRTEGGPIIKTTSTEPGMVLGTVGYMSPEQVRGEPLDARSDIFSFGAILYEMLTGRLAFKCDSAIETLNAILKDDPPDLSDSIPHVSPVIERLVHRCLEKDRANRFQSARDLAFNLEMLANLSSSGTLSRRTEEPPPPPAPPPPVVVPPPVIVPPPPDPPFDATLAVKPAARPAPAPAPRPATPPRPRPATLARPKPIASPGLVVILFLVSVAGAAYAGWYYAQRRAEETGVHSFQRVTFRRGEVRSARFTPDGETIVYSAAWDGRPSDIFVASRRSTEARPLGIRDTDVLAVSKSAELAILMRRDRMTGLGTLARLPLAGGMPRELATNILQADWSPDGSTLAVIRAERNGYRVEYPIGKTRYATRHHVRDVRVSPDGKRMAVIEPHGGAHDIVVVSENGAEPVARGWSHGVTGLAWDPSGKELWITAADTSAPPALWTVSMNGESRMVSRLTGSMKIFDISPDGNVLLSNGRWRAGLWYQEPGSGRERDMSWLDWSVLSDLSADGRTLLFNETREGGGEKGSIYLWREDAPAPVRIGDGHGDALSPDGKFVLSHSGSRLVLLPTGAGEARELKIAGNFALGGAWMPDSSAIIVGGALPKGNYRLHLISIRTIDERVRPLSPEDIASSTVRSFTVSPDGRYVAGLTADEHIALYPTDGSMEAVRVRGVEKGEVPIQWSSDGGSLYVYKPTALPARVYRISLDDGSRRLWREFSPDDPAGVYRIAPIMVSEGGGAYAYNALRMLSDLYVAERAR